MVDGMTTVVTNEVRGVELRLVGYTRALELCARMNRETEVLDFIDEIHPGEVLYDLGACEGRFALYAAMRGVRCYAFEPEALNFRALKENQALNGALAQSNLFPLQYAVGASDGLSVIRIAQPWAGGHHRVVAEGRRVDLELDFTDKQTVEVVSLDSFIQKNSFPSPQYLKVDVDGSELQFMKGAQNTLKSENLKGVMFELQTADSDYVQIVELLSVYGLIEVNRHEIEPDLFNVWFKRYGNS